jgi:hypothetical protein
VLSSRPAEVEEDAHQKPAGADNAEDEEAVPFGAYFRTIPRCGKRFWAQMEPRELHLAESTSPAGAGGSEAGPRVPEGEGARSAGLPRL